MRTKAHVGLALLFAIALIGMLTLGSVAAAGGRTFNLTLSSAAEVPTPTDTASGTAWLQINPGQREACFEITWDDVAGTVTAAHIHEADVGVAGPVVVPLFLTAQPSDANGDGSASGCFASPLHPAELAEIVANPADYYVNVHSTLNPAGAIRAQLSD
jgi:hypothetical protein